MAAHCRSHCRVCHSHFSSDSAFDSHRVFEPGHDGDWDYRVCADLHEAVDKKGRPRFGVKDADGICDVASAEIRTGVPIWTLRASLDSPNPWADMRERSEGATA